jgi:hypothetical protein
MPRLPSDPAAAHLSIEQSGPSISAHLSAHVGEALWSQGWLLDRAELFDRCFTLLKRRFASQPLLSAQIKAVVVEVGESMIRDILIEAPSADAPSTFEPNGFAAHLVSLLGLTPQEAAHAQGRFHRLALPDRQAFLSLLHAPGGRAGDVPPGQRPSGFEGLLDDESGRLAEGAERALLALFDMETLNAKRADHD